MQLATLVDRDIVAGYETLICEVKPDLDWHVGAGIVVERPAATLTMNEMSVVVLLVRPQSRDPACLAMLSPESISTLLHNPDEVLCKFDMVLLICVNSTALAAFCLRHVNSGAVGGSRK